MMHGLMQDRPLALPHVFHRAESQFGNKRIITATPTQARVINYATWSLRVRRLASALASLAVPEGARVGTFASNTQEHLELYFAVPCTGRVLHTINIRLSAEHLRYVIAHAEDDVLFVDRSLFDAIWPLADSLPAVRHWVVIPDVIAAPLPDDPRIVGYEELLDSSEPYPGRFVIQDENTAAGLCYTSGTTGEPKGALYSHRSTVLHSLTCLAAGLLGICERDTVMPIVPMFHVNAWGLPYSAILAGADLALPGSQTRPDELLAFMQGQRVTMAAAVPTIWNGCLPLLDHYRLADLRLLLGGGSSISPALSEAWRAAVGVPITHSWGMTETSPVAVIGGLRSEHDGADPSAQARIRAAQGQPVPLVELRVVDPDTGVEQPWDGKSAGELQAAGPWVAAGYLASAGVEGQSFTADGWLRTGDIGTIDQHGYLRLVDRIKDLIKSGGEWISSIDLENAIMTHPDVGEAAVVARPDPKWDERPVAFVVPVPGRVLTSTTLLEHLRPLVAKWWLPDDIIFVDALPRTGSGKFSKRILRDQFAALRQPPTTP